MVVRATTSSSVGSDAPSQVRLIGGSGADVFRLLSANGIDGTAAAEPQSFKAFIADLSVKDGIDLTAFRMGTVASPSASPLSFVGASESSDDLNVPLDGFVVKGLAAANVTNSVAPTDQVASGSSLGVAFASGIASASAGVLEVQSAMGRFAQLAAATGSPHGASGALASQQIANSLFGLYESHQLLIDSLFYDLSPGA